MHGQHVVVVAVVFEEEGHPGEEVGRVEHGNVECHGHKGVVRKR